MTRLLINIDHVATLRNARRETFPDPVEAARVCEGAGADGIVFHLREDRRHITDEDVVRLRETVRTKLNFELSMAEDIVQICLDTRPELATLVPERREEVTTEGGLDVLAQRGRLATLIPRFYEAGIGQVSLFVDAVPAHIEAAAELGANAIELHTGDYVKAATPEQRQVLLARLGEAAALARRLGLRVHAGHGLDYDNWNDFHTAMPHLDEVSIGFAIVARSIFTGLDAAVREMVQLVKGA